MAVPETDTVSSGSSVASPTADTVTVPELVVEPAAMVNVFALDRAKSPAAAVTPVAVTVTVTASLDAPDSVAVTVETPPVSEIDDGDNDNATSGRSSSSVSVSVTADGAATPLPPVAVPETDTVSSGSSVASPTADTVTVPELVVEPAAMVNVFALDRAKSPAAAVTPVADTVTVTASLDVRSSSAVTVETPPVSEIDDGDNASATVGNVSSSVSVSVTADGAATPLPPVAVAETVTLLSGASVALSTAVIVTVPALVVEPAAIVNVFALDSVKSVPAPGDADTVSVTAALDAPDSVAVTVETFDAPLSSMLEDDNASATVGNVSSSVSVSAPPLTAMVVPSAVARSFVTVAVTAVERPPTPW